MTKGGGARRPIKSLHQKINHVYNLIRRPEIWINRSSTVMCLYTNNTNNINSSVSVHKQYQAHAYMVGLVVKPETGVSGKWDGKERKG